MYESDYFPIFWCGLEMGYSYASGIFGTSPQSGFAGELSGLTPLSSLSKTRRKLNTTTNNFHNNLLFGTMPFRLEMLSLYLQIEILEDADNIQERMTLFESNYYWSEYLTDVYPTIAIFDEEECYVSQLDNPEILRRRNLEY